MGFDLLMGPFLFPKIWNANTLFFIDLLEINLKVMLWLLFLLLYILMKHVVRTIELNEYLDIFMV